LHFSPFEKENVCLLIVHNCKYREEWFAFKQKALEKYVFIFSSCVFREFFFFCKFAAY